MADFDEEQQDLRHIQEIVFGQDSNPAVPQNNLDLPLPTGTQDDAGLAVPIFDNNVEASVAILDLKPLYDKKQKKSLVFGSKQWILDGKVNFVATASAQIVSIHVCVQRCPEAAQRCNDQIGPVELDVVIDRYDVTKTYFSTNLDSVHKNNSSSPVFDLHRIEVEIRNVFMLLIRLEFVDGSLRHYESQPFRVRTQPRTKKSPDRDVEQGSVDSPGSCGSAKRPRVESEEREPLLSGNSTTSDHYSQLSPDSACGTGGGQDYGSSSPGGSSFNTNEVVTDYLEAQRAKIDFLKITNMVCTPKADIAYHLKMSKPSAKAAYAEGDIVGFFTSNTGETEIERLTNSNAATAHMAGVISRSAYLYGNLRDDKEPTDTVCVIGIVQTKVMGPVRNGERIYASMNQPGVALSESTLSLIPPTGKPPTLLGQALEHSVQDKLSEVTLVKCFVSIVLGIQSQQVTDAVNDVRNNLDKRIHNQLEESRRRSRKVWIRNGIILFVFLVLVTVLLFEVFFPGSAFRYWVCRKGSIPDHTMSFVYETTDFQVPTVNGVEFEWDKLKSKLELGFDKINGTGYHYYLNIDRCAFGGVRTVASWIDGYKQVRGAKVFAVNSTCNGAFFELDKEWKRYRSAKDFHCNPPYH